MTQRSGAWSSCCLQGGRSQPLFAPARAVPAALNATTACVSPSWARWLAQHGCDCANPSSACGVRYCAGRRKAGGLQISMVSVEWDFPHQILL
jgi:hypothetical protein